MRLLLLLNRFKGKKLLSMRKSVKELGYLNTCKRQVFLQLKGLTSRQWQRLYKQDLLASQEGCQSSMPDNSKASSLKINQILNIRKETMATPQSKVAVNLRWRVFHSRNFKNKIQFQTKKHSMMNFTFNLNKQDSLQGLVTPSSPFLTKSSC